MGEGEGRARWGGGWGGWSLRGSGVSEVGRGEVRLGKGRWMGRGEAMLGNWGGEGGGHAGELGRGGGGHAGNVEEGLGGGGGSGGDWGGGGSRPCR